VLVLKVSAVCTVVEFLVRGTHSTPFLLHYYTTVERQYLGGTNRWMYVSVRNPY